jgi:hypothetical protein
MAATATPRIQELANKIAVGSDVAPHQLDETAVTNAVSAGNIDDGDAAEFMQFLKELGIEGNVDGTDASINTVDADLEDED